MLNCKLHFLRNGLLLALLLWISSTTAHSMVSVDSLPMPQKEYKGMRVHLHDIQISKKETDWVKITYVPINTGRADLRFGKAHVDHLKNLVIDFDEDFYASNLADLRAEIEKNLYYEDLTVFAGAIHQKKEMKIETKGYAVALNEELMEKGSGSSSKKSDEGSFSINVGQSDEASNFLDKTTCPDLIISEVKILKQSKKSVTIEYTIANQGKGPANLLGEKKGNQDNVAFKAHLSRSSKLNRGAIVVGGDFVKDLPKEKNGLLQAGESHTGTIKLDIRKMTRFTPVIILELDTYQNVRECDERNNRNHVKVEL